MKALSIERVNINASAFLILLLALTGCSLAPAYKPPVHHLPATWNAPSAMPKFNNMQESNDPVSAPRIHWQEFVTDQRLAALIQTALEKNLDLRQTLLHVEVSKGLYRAQHAAQFPEVQMALEGTRQQSLTGQAKPDANQGAFKIPAFELDLFGRLYNSSKSAFEEYLATDEGARQASLSLVTEIIQAYVSRQGILRSYELHHQILESRSRSFGLISNRFYAGTASLLHYQQAKMLLNQAQGQLEAIDRDLYQSTNALALLVGQTAIDLSKEGKGTSTPIVQHLQPGAPLDLLLYRPDILAAEHMLKASYADVGVARAAFFPSITLAALFGSSYGTNLSSSSGGFRQRVWNFSSAMTLPLFSAGKNTANLDVALAMKDAALANYEMTVLNAFTEVSDSLAATETLTREEAMKKAAAEDSQRSLNVAKARYKAGLDDFLVYLDAQRSYLENQVLLTTVQTQRQSALATLFRTLGGSWMGQK